MRERPAQSKSFGKSPTPAGLRTVRRIPAIARFFLASVLFLSLAFASRAGWFERKPDYSNYDVPLYEQITNDIKAKILARLGEGRNTRDRYFIIPFAYQNEGIDPELSHSFMSVIRILPDVKQSELTPGLEKRTYKNRAFQAFTISWLPHDFTSESDLCVFDGFGARLIPTLNRCPTSVGRDFKLDETIKLAVGCKNAVCMWGPYEISKDAFDLGVKRMRLLDTGVIKYRADDRLTRKDRVAINCFHAMAGLYDLFPNGGIFGTGFKMWGINGTARVLIEYTARAGPKGLLLEPVDAKRDRFGFVYSPKQNGRCYNPFETASAYWR